MTDLQIKLTLASNGRVLIPATMRAAVGLKDGDRVIARVEGGAIVLEPVEAAVRRAQAIVAKYVLPDVSAVDELIAERRAEAEARGVPAMTADRAWSRVASVDLVQIR